MNTSRKTVQPVENGQFSKQDIWGLLFTVGVLLAAMLIRCSIYLPRFL